MYDRILPCRIHDDVTVLCFHSSTASGAQWAALGKELGDGYRVRAPDLYGYGDAPAWHGARPLQLVDEVHRFDALFAEAPGGVHLVGHSYGGAVALRAALRHPQRVRSVTVYEPVLFGLLDRVEPAGAALAESWSIARRVLERIAAGDRAVAAERFVDYWSGAGAWARLPAWQQAAIARRMDKTALDFAACFGDPMTLAELAGLPMPVHCLHGEHAPASTRAICRWLVDAAGFSGGCIAAAGHLGPMTHAAEVNAAIRAFIEGVEPARVAATDLPSMTTCNEECHP